MRASTVTKNFRYMRCVRFDRWRGATKEHSRQRSVTEEQQSYRSNLAQPFGLPSFSPLPALLAPLQTAEGYARRSRLGSGEKSWQRM